MARPILLALALLAAATAANAQGFGRRAHGPPPGEGPPGEGRGPPLFLSPAGEPFRGPDGLGTWFAGADADHDGSITVSELRADMFRYFRKLDVNGDGTLDGFEIQAYERDEVPELARMPFEFAAPEGRAGRRMGTGRTGAGRFGLLNIPQPVANADEDVDGKVSSLEWEHAVVRRFGLLDKAKSGRLTLGQLKGEPPKKK